MAIWLTGCHLELNSHQDKRRVGNQLTDGKSFHFSRAMLCWNIWQKVDISSVFFQHISVKIMPFRR